jgi:hypothetical protein
MSECDGSDGEVLMSGVVSVRVEVTDPSDGQVHVFEGPDEVRVQRQVDEFFGVEEADRRELDTD